MRDRLWAVKNSSRIRKRAGCATTKPWRKKLLSDRPERKIVVVAKPYLEMYNIGMIELGQQAHFVTQSGRGAAIPQSRSLADETQN